MTLLHTMSLAGSIAVGIYLLLYFLTKRYLSVLWHKIYLTINIFLFIIPFACFKTEYTEWLKTCLGLKAWYQRESVVRNMKDFTIFVYQEGVYVPNLPIYIILLISVLMGVGGLMVFIKKYKTVYQKIMRGVVRFERGELVINELRKGSKIHIKSKVYLCVGIKTPITIGIIHRKIVLPDIAWEDSRLRDALRHELVHVRAMDNLVKVVLLIVVILNFYNPFVYYLWYKWNLVTEMYCDYRVTVNKSVQETGDYIRLIIDFAEMQGAAGLPIVGLNISEKQIKERIENMKNIKKLGKKYGKISRMAGVFIIVAAVFTSSLTVYAYEKRQVKYHDKPYERVEDIFWYDNWEDAVHAESYAEYDAYEQYINADNIVFFVSETGEVYYDVYTEQDGYRIYSSCSHTYVSGTISEHVKNSKGGCKMDYYDGKRCNRCGHVVYGDHIKTTLYDVCPH